jgi:hypothetical protein
LFSEKKICFLTGFLTVLDVDMTAMLKNIKEDVPNAELVEILERYLAEAKSGKLRTMVLLRGYDGGRFSYSWFIDKSCSRYALVGATTMMNQDMITMNGLYFGDSELAEALAEITDKI